MNPRRRLHIKKRIHQTAHRRAMQYPNVQTMIDELRLDWTTLSPVGRGDRLRELAGLGCSTRGLGEQLGESGTSVRRHMELAALPSESRDAVNGGASAKKILAKKALVDRQKRRQERVTEDQRTGRFSDRVADIILEFCQGEGKPERTPILAAEFPQFLTLVKSYLPCADNVNRSAAKLGKKFGVCKLFKQTRPTQKADVLWIEYQAEWLADAIIVMAPEGPIRNRALAKAKGRADGVFHLGLD